MLSVSRGVFATCAALLFVSPALSQSKDDISEKINSSLPSTGRGQITAQNLRDVMNAFNAARGVPNGLADLDAAGKLPGDRTPSLLKPDTLQILGPGSTGDISSMSVTPNASAAAGTLGAFTSAFPGASASVAGIGVPGLDNPPGFFIYQHPSTNTSSPGLRVQRDVPAAGTSADGFTYKAIWGLTNTTKNQAGYEWAITGEVNNHTLGTTGAQHVGVNGTIFKRKIAEGQTGKSWGGNFACNDQTGQVDPSYACVGTEFNSTTIANGTDANRQRVGAHIAVGSSTPSTGAHIGYGLLITTNAQDVIDRGIGLRMPHEIGLDTTGATFTKAAIMLGEGHRIALDGNDSGVYNRSLRFQAGFLIYQTQDGSVFQVGDRGDIVAKSLISPSANTGVFTGLHNKTVDPTLSDIPAGQCTDWSTNGTLRRWCNIGGVLRSITYN